MHKNDSGISLFVAILSLLAVFFVQVTFAIESTMDKVEIIGSTPNALKIEEFQKAQETATGDAVAVALDSNIVMNIIASVSGLTCTQIVSYAWVVTAFKSTVAVTFGISGDAIDTPTCTDVHGQGPVAQVTLPLTVPTGTTITLPTSIQDKTAFLSSLGLAIQTTGADNGVDINTVGAVTNAITGLALNYGTTTTTTKITWLFGQQYESCDNACSRLGTTCDPLSQAQLSSESAARAAASAAAGGEQAGTSANPCTGFMDAAFYDNMCSTFPAFGYGCYQGMSYSSVTPSLCDSRPSQQWFNIRLCACNYVTPTPTASPTAASQASCYSTAPDEYSTAISVNGVTGNKFTFSGPVAVDVLYEMDFAGGLEFCLEYGCKQMLFAGILGYDAQGSCMEATSPGLYPVSFSQNLTSEGCYHIFLYQSTGNRWTTCQAYGPVTGYADPNPFGPPAGTWIGSIWIEPVVTDTPSASPSATPSVSPSATPSVSPSATPSVSPSAAPTQGGVKQSRRPHKHVFVSRSPSRGPHKLTKRYPAPRSGISV